MDIPGVLLSAGGMFCVVFGFSNAATHGWHAPSTWGFLVAGFALLAAFAVWIGRAADPLLPPRVVLNRNRGGAYVSVLVGSLCVFATLLAVASYVVAHESARTITRPEALNQLALAHGYETAFWWMCGIAAGGAVVAGLLLRPGPLVARAPARNPEPSGDPLPFART